RDWFVPLRKRRPWDGGRLLFGGLTLMPRLRSGILLVLVAAVATGAPVPRYRPIVRPSLAGEWALDCGDAVGRILFRADGTYRLLWRWGGKGYPWHEYAGWWKLHGDTLAFFQADMT